MKKKLIFAVFAIVFCVFVTGCSKTIKINETTDIKEDNIKLTILGSEQVTINKEALELDGYTMENGSNGDYIKVKMSIENYGSSTYNFSATTFYLGEEPISLLTMSEDDYIDQSIEPGATATGYVYFPVVKSEKMSYYVKNMEVTGSNSAKSNKYVFAIK